MCAAQFHLLSFLADEVLLAEAVKVFAEGVVGFVISFLSYFPRFLPVCTLIIFGPVMLGVPAEVAEDEAVVFAGELTPFSSSLSSTLHFNFLTVKGLPILVSRIVSSSSSSLVAIVRSEGLLLLGVLINFEPSSPLVFWSLLSLLMMAALPAAWMFFIWIYEPSLHAANALISSCLSNQTYTEIIATNAIKITPKIATSVERSNTSCYSFDSFIAIDSDSCKKTLPL